MLRKIFQWIVYSSANPQLISLTIKGFVPFLLLFGIDSTDAEALSSAVSQVILLLGQVVFGAIGIFGLVRKINNSR